jgi:hypothetical protein
MTPTTQASRERFDRWWTLEKGHSLDEEHVELFRQVWDRAFVAGVVWERREKERTTDGE